jgi:hypothetical protein
LETAATMENTRIAVICTPAITSEPLPSLPGPFETKRVKSQKPCRMIGTSSRPVARRDAYRLPAAKANTIWVAARKWHRVWPQPHVASSGPIRGNLADFVWVAGPMARELERRRVEA